jgi:ABC-type uncharacterized transport system ATPase subunit
MWVEAICDRALIIHHGRIVADGRVEEIRANRTASVRLVVRGALDDARGAFDGLPGVQTVEVAPAEGSAGYVSVKLVGSADRALCEAAAQRAIQRGFGLARLSPETASLEDIFAELTSSNDRAGAPADESAAEVARA